MVESFPKQESQVELPEHDPFRPVKGLGKYAGAAIIILLLLIGGFQLMSLMKHRSENHAHLKKIFMNTAVEIDAYGPAAKEAALYAFDEMENAARAINIYDPKSEVSLVNSMSGIASVAVGKSTFDLIIKSLKFSELLENSFDITIGPLTEIWNVSDKNFRVPTPLQIKEAQKLVGFRLIEVIPQVESVKLVRRGMKLDLGGVGKGYVVSIGRNALLSKGIKNALISTGSSIVCVGARPDGKPWRVGVRDPGNKGNLIGVVELKAGQALSTSGYYEQYIDIDGKRYTHIIDPRTGYPASSTEAVTVITDDATVSDILSTAMFVLGPADGPRVLSKFDNVEALIIDYNNNVITTPGFVLERP